MSNYQFNAEQNKVIGKLVADCLAAEPHRFFIPELKGPYVEKARACGFTVKLARVVAEEVLDAFRARYRREREAEDKRDECSKAIEDSLGFNQLPTDELIKSFLAEYKIAVASAEVKYMHQKVLYKKVWVFRDMKYRCPTHGICSLKFGDESSVTQDYWSDRTTYRGHWKGRECFHIDTFIVFNKSFVANVYEKGLAFSDKYIVLEARKVRVTGVEGAVYKVKYVYQNPKVTAGHVVQLAEGYLKVTDDGRKIFTSLDELKNGKKKKVNRTK